MSLLAPTLQAFFTERLITQRNASPQTIASYRDTIRLLLRFAHQQTGKHPCELDIDDLDAPLIGAFLNHLEQERGNSISTRNARLAAIHSFHRYAALKHPEHVATIGRVMAIPSKRHERNTVSYLNLKEIKALLRAPDRTTSLGRRDHAILLTAIQTGVRVTELVTLRIRDVTLSTGAHATVTGKGRKKRTTNPTPETVAVLRQWLKERQGQPDEPLFPTRADPIRGRNSGRQAHGHRGRRLPVAEDQARHPARAQTHQRDAPASRRRRHRDDCALARPREHQNHQHLRARRPRPQRTSHRTDRAARNAARQIPAVRHAPRVPRPPVIMSRTSPA
jgi:site-specific recombinase XerD